MFNLETHKKDFRGVVEYFRQEISSIKTGRATPALVEDLEVEVYNSKMRLKELASLSVSDSRTLVIQPWDKKSVGSIEKALRAANLGLNPIAEKDLLRITFPPLTEERRKEYIKLLHSKMEDARIKIRRLRDDIRKDVQNDESLREDEQFKAKENLQKMVDEHNKEIQEIADKKEQELLTT